jgi:hypothetical protein
LSDRPAYRGYFRRDPLVSTSAISAVDEAVSER